MTPDLEALAASVFPGASIVADDEAVMVVLLRDRLLHLSLSLRPCDEGWRAWLCWDGDRVREGIAVHTDPAEALRLARKHLETMFATLIGALAPPDDEPFEGYGAFPGGDPRTFTPDAEVCTPDELAAHAAACKAADEAEARGEVVNLPAAHLYGFFEGGAWHTPHSPFGVGTYSIAPDPAPERLPASLVRTMDAILSRLLAGESAASVAADYTADDDPLTAADLARFEALALAVRHEAEPDRLAALELRILRQEVAELRTKTNARTTNPAPGGFSAPTE